MTYQQIKKTLVDDEKLLTAKQLRSFVIKWALMVFGFALMLILPTFSILGSRIAIFIVVVAALLFSEVLSLIHDDPGVFNKFKVLVKFWWITYIFTVLIYLVLKFFNFM
jgi:hypothetical protein